MAEVMSRPRCPIECLADRLKGGGISIVAIHVTQQRTQLLEHRRIDSAVLLKALTSPRPKLFKGPAGFGDSDDRHVEAAAFDHGLQ